MLRLTETGSGLTLERALDAKQPVVRQKKKLLDMFYVTLQTALPGQFPKNVFGKIGAKGPIKEIQVVHGAAPKSFIARKPAKAKANLVLSQS